MNELRGFEIYACPDCKPLHELPFHGVREDGTFRLQCDKCGQWWLMDNRLNVLQKGKVEHAG
jgi:uncharacterized Zn finger protein